MKRIVVLLVLTAAVLATGGTANASNSNRVLVRLAAQNGSNISGSVSASALNGEQLQTSITVLATSGAISGASYKAYYYTVTGCSGTGSNIGGPFKGQSGGTARVHATVSAGLNSIMSVSITDINGVVVACAKLH